MVYASGNHLADLARGQGVLKPLGISKNFKVVKVFELSIEISYYIVTEMTTISIRNLSAKRSQRTSTIRTLRVS